jgi:hypothetical protein
VYHVVPAKIVQLPHELRVEGWRRGRRRGLRDERSLLRKCKKMGVVSEDMNVYHDFFQLDEK